MCKIPKNLTNYICKFWQYNVVYNFEFKDEFDRECPKWEISGTNRHIRLTFSANAKHSKYWNAEFDKTTYFGTGPRLKFMVTFKPAFLMSCNFLRKHYGKVIHARETESR